jgi:hypothetical protein
MSFEKPEDLNPTEKEGNPEILAEGEAVNEKAGEVAAEMEGADMENMDSDDKAILRKKVFMVMSALLAVGGVTAAYFDVPAHNLQGLQDGFKEILNSRFGMDVGTAWIGVGTFMAHYFRMRELVKSKEGNKG